MTKVTKDEIKKMMQHAVHVGHRTSKWNPKMKKFIHGERNGVHFINLEKTASQLEESLKFLEKLASEGKNILFVSTKPQAGKIIERAAKDAGMPFVTNRWIPGFLTNYGTIKKRIKYLSDLKEQKENGEFEKYTKKEVVKLEKTIQKLEDSLGGVQNLSKKPDAIFVLDIVRDKIVVDEANVLQIPVVGLADTNSDPTLVTVPIPANDDAIKSIEYLIEKIVGVISKYKK